MGIQLERDFGFPSQKLFVDACRHGLSVVRPMAARGRDDEYGWNFGSARPPSYWAYGRLRALLALSMSHSLCNKPKRVLEVAAGDAALCACLEQFGCDVTANDLRGENLEQAVANFWNGSKIRLLPGDLFALDPDAVGCFDLVIACEIIEHVAHPLAFLRRLKRFLKADGHILLTTPNGAYFRNKLQTYSEVEDFDALEANQFKPDADGHLFLITPTEMEKLASQAGLMIDHFCVWGTPFVSGECGFRLLSKILPTQLCYGLEHFFSGWPKPVRHWIANSMSVVLSQGN